MVAYLHEEDYQDDDANQCINAECYARQIPCLMDVDPDFEYIRFDGLILRFDAEEVCSWIQFAE